MREATSADGILASPELRQELTTLALDASYDDVVHLNFFDYMYRMMWGAYGDGSSVPRAQIRELFNDHSLVEMLWRAATAKPLNHRMIGSLLQYR